MDTKSTALRDDLGNQIIEATLTAVAMAGQYQMSLMTKPGLGLPTPAEAMQEQTKAMHVLCNLAYVVEREYHRRVWIGGDPANQVKKVINDQVGDKVLEGQRALLNAVRR